MASKTIKDITTTQTTLNTTDWIEIQEDAGTSKKAQIQSFFNALYPVGSFYVQYPDAASNDDATAFPSAKRPATLFGGTWAEQFNTENVFFRTAGTDGQTRSAGLSLDQMQRITGSWSNAILRNPENNTGAMSGNGSPVSSGASGAGGSGYGINFDSANSPDARVSASTSGFTEPRNRLMKLWKRTAL